MAPFDGPVDFERVARRIEAHPIEGDPQEMRARFAELVTGSRAPAPLPVADIGGVPTARIDPPGGAQPPSDAALVYFHGGGYVFGSPATHARLLRALATATGRSVYAPRYRRAPEYPWPAMLDDALALCTALREGGNVHLVVAGDSAGGHLALNTALALAERGTPAAGVLAFSPNTDRSGRSRTREANTPTDPMNSDADDRALAERTFGDNFDPRDPQVSPLLADLSALPPVHLEVGGREVLLDDSRLFHQRLLEAGGRATLHEDPDAFHMWQIWVPWLPAARASVERAGQWVRDLR